ncbi:MAG: DUF309 domain-containing protein [Candidatus Rokuibacteriota bacterium]
MPLPLSLRNTLAELILDALHDSEARAALAALCAVCDDPRALAAAPPPARFPVDLFEARDDGLAAKDAAHGGEMCARARRGWAVVRERPLDPPHAPLPVALSAAAALFDGGLYFETHEQLEPHWMRAHGEARDAIQGLIQVAVGFQHLANGNPGGARALLGEGAAKLAGRRLAGRDLDAFARETRGCHDKVMALGDQASARFSWTQVPRFPAVA